MGPTLGPWFNPLLASHARRGVCAIKKITRTFKGADGVVSFHRDRKTTPASLSKDASRNFLYRSATPPCGHARRGVTLYLR